MVHVISLKLKAMGCHICTGVEEAGSEEMMDLVIEVCNMSLHRCGGDTGVLPAVCTGVEEAGSEEMMNLVQEAHIMSVDVGDDRLGDDEWNLLSNTASLVLLRHRPH